MNALEFRLSTEEQTKVNQFVNDFNHRLNPEHKPQQSLGKNDFLKLLLTQLSYQDPLSPVEDKEFIAQMAQFSTLEQMTSMSADFSKLTSMVSGSEAVQSLGKNVEVIEGEEVIQGAVKAVTRGEIPMVLVNGSYYNWNLVNKVFEE
ncbi:MAG: flagellar hook assembly protein FlgD [Treponema sp.]|nr:flagellar hook assembly protein FlgD [Treponema sp.]